MVRKSQLFMALMKLGTAFLDKLPPLMKNAKLTLLDFICRFLKMFKKFFFLNLQNKKDGTLFTLNGLILLSVVWKVWFTLTLMVRNGYKLMSELHMPSWKSWNRKEEFSKSKKPKKMENLILKFKWINKHSRQKENMQLENSYSIYKFTSQLLTSREVPPTLINTYK